MQQNKTNTSTNTIINSTFYVKGNFRVGNDFFYNGLDNNNKKAKSIWDIIKVEYKKRNLQHNLLDAFFWNNSTGQLSHFIFNDSSDLNVQYESSCKVQNNLGNTTGFNGQLENANIKLIPILLSVGKLIDPFNDNLREFSIKIDADHRFTYDDFGELGKRTTVLNKWATKYIDGNQKISIQRLKTKDWFEYEIDSIRLNLLFNSDKLQDVYMLRHQFKNNPICYIFLVGK